MSFTFFFFVFPSPVCECYFRRINSFLFYFLAYSFIAVRRFRKFKCVTLLKFASFRMLYFVSRFNMYIPIHIYMYSILHHFIHKSDQLVEQNFFSKTTFNSRSEKCLKRFLFFWKMIQAKNKIERKI